MQEKRIKLQGDLRGEDRLNEIRELIATEWEAGTERLTIDLSGSTSIDYDTVVEFLSARNRFRQAGVHLNLTGMTRSIQDIAEVFRIPV